MKKTAVFPGSFDPFTVGHEEIVNRALRIFDNIVIAVGVNSMKKEFIELDDRVALIRKAFQGNDRVEVATYAGLTVSFCKEVGADVIIRGLRTAADFEYERAVGQANRAMDAEVETVLILTSTDHTFISSSIVRNIYLSGGDVGRFLPKGISTADLDACFRT